MQTINHVNILGYVGKAAEFYKNQYGTKAILSVATRSNERIQWHVVAFYDKDAEAIALLKRGDEILITGCLEYFKWVDCNGNERIAPEIAVNSFNIVKGQKIQDQHFNNNDMQHEDMHLNHGQDQHFNNNDIQHEDMHLNHGQDQHFNNNDIQHEDMHLNHGQDQHFNNNDMQHEDMHLSHGQDQHFNVKGGYGNHHQTFNDFFESNSDDKFDLEHYQHGGFSNPKQYY